MAFECPCYERSYKSIHGSSTRTRARWLLGRLAFGAPIAKPPKVPDGYRDREGCAENGNCHTHSPLQSMGPRSLIYHRVSGGRRRSDEWAQLGRVGKHEEESVDDCVPRSVSLSLSISLSLYHAPPI